MKQHFPAETSASSKEGAGKASRLGPSRVPFTVTPFLGESHVLVSKETGNKVV